MIHINLGTSLSCRLMKERKLKDKENSKKKQSEMHVTVYSYNVTRRYL